MSVETNAKFITELNEAYPRRGDLIKEGDDHMRLVKSVLKNTLPNFNRTINMSSEKLNHLDSMVETTDNTLTIAGNITIKDKKTINMGDNVVTKVSDPVEDTDAVNKRYLKKEGMEYAWPVGSIYITMDARDPKEIFGFGEWEKFASGRVLIGVGSDKDANNEAKLIALGAKGGTYNEKLEPDHLAEHTHSAENVQFKTTSSGAHTHNIRAGGHKVLAWIPGAHGATSGGNWDVGEIYAEEAGAHTHEGTLSGELAKTGKNKPHNNMMPYIGVNMWKRNK